MSSSQCIPIMCMAFEPCDGETAQALDLCPIAHDAPALDDASLIGETLENFSLSVDLID